MTELRKKDRELWIRESFLGRGAIFTLGSVAVAAFLYWVSQQGVALVGMPWQALAVILTFGIGGGMYVGFQAMKDQAFRISTLRKLWEDSEDALHRLDQSLKDIKKEQLQELAELSQSMKDVSEQLFWSLRRADHVMCTVARTEAGRPERPARDRALRHLDRETQEMFQIADRNLNDYRRMRGQLDAMVRRVEAQAEVFITTVETLRMHIHRIRLSTLDQSRARPQFVDAIVAAQRELKLIDRTLRELEEEESRAAQELDGQLLPPDAPLRQTPPPIPIDAPIREEQEHRH